MKKIIMTLLAVALGCSTATPDIPRDDDASGDDTEATSLLDARADLESEASLTACSGRTTCATCTLDPACGYCRGSGECLPGTASGPAAGTCAGGWVWRASACSTLQPLDVPIADQQPMVDAVRPADSDGSMPDAGGPCPEGLFDCNGRCLNLRGDDRSHCGRCGRRCYNYSDACRAGACACTSGTCEGTALHCVGGATICPWGQCADLQTDPYSCGACGVVCAAHETCSSGRCCAGGACSSCGDGRCRQPYEDPTSCPRDCRAVCGDGRCDVGETCGSCAADCGCAAGLSCLSSGVCVRPNVCGNFLCDGAENCGTCAADCGPCPRCGDGVCNGAETRSTCAADCGSCSALDYTVVCASGSGRCPSRSTCTGTSCVCDEGMVALGCDGVICDDAHPCGGSRRFGCVRLGCGELNFDVPCGSGTSCPHNAVCSVDADQCECAPGYHAETCEGRRCTEVGVHCERDPWWCTLD